MAVAISRIDKVIAAMPSGQIKPINAVLRVRTQRFNFGYAIAVPCGRTSSRVLKLSVVERYGKNGQVGSAFVRGFKLKFGALASSVSHDHHNIVIVGTNDEDMYLAAKELEKCQGGFAALENGVVKGILPLPIGGLMSTEPAAKVMKEIDALNRVVGGMGSDLPAPFMSLSFVSLPTVPELGLTDRGLISVKAQKKIPVVVG